MAQELVENLPTLRPQSLHPLTRRARRRRRGRQPPEHPAAAVRQRRHGRDLDQRRRRPQQQLHAGRRAEHEPRRGHERQPGIRALARRRAGSARRDQHLRRAVRPDRRRHHRGVDSQRHQPVPRHRLLHPSRRRAEREPLREHRARHSEAGDLPLQPWCDDRRADQARPDVLLLFVRRAEVGDSRGRGSADADRARAERRLLPVRVHHLRPAEYA